MSSPGEYTDPTDPFQRTPVRTAATIEGYEFSAPKRLPSMTPAEIARFTGPPSLRGPALVAERGFLGSAFFPLASTYYRDGDGWRNCATDALWDGR